MGNSKVKRLQWHDQYLPDVDMTDKRYISKHAREQCDQNAHGLHVEFICLLLRSVGYDHIDNSFNKCV